MEQAIENFSWLVKQWWAWVAFFISIPIGWYLFSQRQYRMKNGKGYVRHGRLGKWIDLENHLKDDHKIT